MKPSRQLDGVQISSGRRKTFDGLQNDPNVIERMIETTWLGVTSEQDIERSACQRGVDMPGRQKIMPFSGHLVVYVSTVFSLLRKLRPTTSDHDGKQPYAA